MTAWPDTWLQCEFSKSSSSHQRYRDGSQWFWAEMGTLPSWLTINPLTFHLLNLSALLCDVSLPAASDLPTVSTALFTQHRTTDFLHVLIEWDPGMLWSCTCARVHGLHWCPNIIVLAQDFIKVMCTLVCHSLSHPFTSLLAHRYLSLPAIHIELASECAGMHEQTTWLLFHQPAQTSFQLRNWKTIGQGRWHSWKNIVVSHGHYLVNILFRIFKFLGLCFFFPSKRCEGATRLNFLSPTMPLFFTDWMSY